MLSSWLSTSWLPSSPQLPTGVSLPESETLTHAGNLLVGLETGKLSQTRYKLLDRQTGETIAGIKDTSLRVSGKPVVRFDTGAVTGKSPHIDFDLKGYPNRSVPPISVPESIVNFAHYGQATLEVASTVLTVATYASDAFRLGTAVKQDIDEYQKAGEKINQLEGLVGKLANDHLDVFGDDLDDTRLTVRWFSNLKAQNAILVDAKAKQSLVPVSSITEASSILGGWTGGLVGGYTGGYVGGTLGGTVGSLLGPPGTLVGSIVGAVGGSLYGAVMATQASSQTAEDLAGKAIQDGLGALIPSREQLEEYPKTVIPSATEWASTWTAPVKGYFVQSQEKVQ